MIQISKDLQLFRCTAQKYLVKKGSMSNYSFDIIDEKGTGVLDALFEKTQYPIDEAQFHKMVADYLGCEAEEFIQKLLELEVLKQTVNHPEKHSLFIITSNENHKLLKQKFENLNYNIIGIYDQEKLDTPDSTLEEGIQKCEVVLILSNTFRPDVFYALNPYIIKHETKTVIAYMDGDEGIIIPLVNPNKYGCYNDYEMMREASFHNLLEYQIMKEEMIKNKPVKQATFYAMMLFDWAIIVMNRMCTESQINHFAYSLDFERMHFTKTKLFRFPKCPSCQGDKNLTHPFI